MHTYIPKICIHEYIPAYIHADVSTYICTHILTYVHTCILTAYVPCIYTCIENWLKTLNPSLSIVIEVMYLNAWCLKQTKQKKERKSYINVTFSVHEAGARPVYGFELKLHTVPTSWLDISVFGVFGCHFRIKQGEQVFSTEGTYAELNLRARLGTKDRIPAKVATCMFMRVQLNPQFPVCPSVDLK